MEVLRNSSSRQTFPAGELLPHFWWAWIIRKKGLAKGPSYNSTGLVLVQLFASVPFVLFFLCLAKATHLSDKTHKKICWDLLSKRLPMIDPPVKDQCQCPIIWIESISPQIFFQLNLAKTHIGSKLSIWLGLSKASSKNVSSSGGFRSTHLLEEENK